ETTVDDILSEDLTTIEPYADVREAGRLMAGRRIRRLPVVEDGQLIGIVSLGDISVKDEDDRVTGETLQEISQGVKGSANRPARGKRAAPVRAAGPQSSMAPTQGRVTHSFEEDEAFDLEFTDEVEEPVVRDRMREGPTMKGSREQPSTSNRKPVKEK